MDDYQFTVKELTKLYNGKKVLDIPHLVIKKGMIYGVMGPNGSGKTTLLSILSLLIRPTSGRIYFEGLELDGSKTDELTVRRQMTMVLQNPFLLTTTVEKNVAYGLKIRGMHKKDRRQRVKECLDLVGLPGFEKRKAGELSGGEAQRVAIARGIAVNPKVLLLDEPTANVDKTNREVLEDIMNELNHRYKTTIVFTTHDSNQAYRLADEIIVLSDGRVQGTQSKDEFRIAERLEKYPLG
ncbi:MAG: phosphate ABC transporter ATP-binding protein [Pseudomonadota bacterium]